MTPIKRMSPKEFRELGYLQELNRQFLHPLGLALETVVDDKGGERFGEVWDSRDDPEGITYGDDMIDPVKTIRIHAAGVVKAIIRQTRFGWIVQPGKGLG